MNYNIFKLLLILSVFLLQTACISQQPRYRSNKSVKVINKTPATVVQHSSKLRIGDTIRGTSSYYGKYFHGKITANGETFNMYGISAAHKSIPLGSKVRVKNLYNGRTKIAIINDRGPYIDGRILDCSYGLARELGFVNDGLAEVEITILKIGDGKYKKR